MTVEIVPARAAALAPRPRGLPVPQLDQPASASAAYYATTTVDDRGRIGSRSPQRELGWVAGSAISFRIVEGVVVVARAASGGQRIGRRGHLRLPATVRHRCHLAGGNQVLVVAVRDLDVLEVYPLALVDSLLRRRACGRSR